MNDNYNPVETTDKELNILAQKLEIKYKAPTTEGGLNRGPVQTHVDNLGHSRWRRDYFYHRDKGLSPEAAWQKINSEINKIAGIPGDLDPTGDNTIPLPPPVTRLKPLRDIVTVNGKYFHDADGPVAPMGTSALYALNDNKDPRPFLDFLAGKVQVVRTFAGRLFPNDTRTGQTTGKALERLTPYLGWLKERDLRVELVCNTDTAGTPYDEHNHADQIARIAMGFRKTVLGLQIRNEIGHNSDRPIEFNELMDIRNVIREAGYDGPVSLGASLNLDELDVNTGMYPYAYTGHNSYATMHLNRGKKPSYREAFRKKEFRDIQFKHDCGICDDEPGRLDHPDLTKEAYGPERFAYILGVLGVAFNCMTFLHSSALRDCVVPNGIEASAFLAYLRAISKIPRGVYDWQNADNTDKWPNSPVKNGAFMEGPSNSSVKALWRAYSFLGPIDFVIAGGENPGNFNIEYQNRYYEHDVIDSVFDVELIEIARG